MQQIWIDRPLGWLHLLDAASDLSGLHLSTLHVGDVAVAREI